MTFANFEERYPGSERIFANSGLLLNPPDDPTDSFRQVLGDADGKEILMFVDRGTVVYVTGVDFAAPVEDVAKAIRDA